MNNILRKDHIDELTDIRERHDFDSWRVGEIAVETWFNNVASGGKQLQYAIWAEIAHYAGCSTSQIEKMYALVQKFPPDIRALYPGYRLAYFETAAQFPGEELDVLDFIGVIAEEQGAWPVATRVGYLYRRDVIGLVVNDEMVIDGHPTLPIDDIPASMLEGNPFDRPSHSLQTTLVSVLKQLRNLTNDGHLSYETRQKLILGIQSLESVLPELAGVSQRVT